MTATDLATIEQPTRQAIEAQDRSKPLQVTGKLKRALEAMVWEGARRNEAAEKAGMTDHSLRSALKKPHVKRHYLAELDVLRTSERARNIHTLAEVRDQKSNQMARVQAVKALEQLADDEPTQSARSRVPGVTIIIAGAAPQTTHLVQNDPKPLIDMDAVLHPHNEQHGNGDE